MIIVFLLFLIFFFSNRLQLTGTLCATGLLLAIFFLTKNLLSSVLFLELASLIIIINYALAFSTCIFSIIFFIFILLILVSEAIIRLSTLVFYAQQNFINSNKACF